MQHPVLSFLSGGSFLVQDTDTDDVFIAELCSEEHQMIRQMVRDFCQQEILPRLPELDAQSDLSLAPRLLEKAAGLGFLGVGVPEIYGGMGQDRFVTSVIAGAEMAQTGSFMLTIGVQTSIGIAPILFYGNEDQKSRYLPRMVSAELKSSYCLTEPEAGSDANSGKTRAVLNAAGTHYLLNGQKMWITNAGFADMFIVFAKIEDDANLSAFIVEKAFGGIALGEEEKKMGIKGSSTRQVFFNETPVPVENLLGERGQGFKMALNVLNTGRFKLGVVGLGVGIQAINHSIRYALERRQFGQAIASFGAIQHKLGEMATRLYALDAALYRTADVMDRAYDALVAQGLPAETAKPQSVEAFAIECAMLKVYGSETQSFIVDEGLQIFGGMGFSAEAPMERLYRDARINRIYEGTNEINRMLIVDMLLKKALKGQLDLMTPAMAISKELSAMPAPEGDASPLETLHRGIQKLKKASLMVLGAAVQKLMMQLKDEQEILLNLSDMLIQCYMAESALLKTMRLAQHQGAEDALRTDLAALAFLSAAECVQRAGREAICAFAEGDEQRVLLMGLKRFATPPALNAKEARRRVAKALCEAEKWGF